MLKCVTLHEILNFNKRHVYLYNTEGGRHSNVLMLSMCLYVFSNQSVTKWNDSILLH